jgi:hypothetical protein
MYHLQNSRGTGIGGTTENRSNLGLFLAGPNQVYDSDLVGRSANGL